MPQYVGLLYSVAFDGTHRVRAADLVAVAEAAGLAEPRPLLATGNLIFSADAADERTLERRLERAFAARAGQSSPIMVRSAADWQRLAAQNPFPAESARDGSLVAARIQRDRLDSAAVGMLAPFRQPDEGLAIVDGDLWVSFPVQMSQRRLLAALTPKRLGIGTLRNWNTIRKIAGLLEKG
jgi:uncharacterized protein (DUF1697 family)